MNLQFRQFMLLVLVGFITTSVTAATGKLLAASGVPQFEGTAGGGIVPWAILSGHAARDEISLTAFSTLASTDNFDLSSWGTSLNVHDKVELSYTEQKLDGSSLTNPIKLRIVGFKYRLYGDIVYSPYPQIAIGLQHKRLEDRAVIQEARNNRGTDIYLSMTKYHLAAFANYNLLWNLTLRSTRSNQTGFLGFGGNKNDQLQLQWGASLALQLNRTFFIGGDYRTKPNNLETAREQDWSTLFIRYIPNKKFNMTLAYLNFGEINGLSNQTGVYFSLTGNL